MTRRTALAAGCLAAALAIMAGRAWIDGARALANGKAALAARDDAAAARELAWAAHWSLPWGGPAAEAADLLEALAARRLDAGDRAGALGAYEDLHAALYAARSALPPDAERLARIRTRIAELRFQDGVGRAGRSVEDYLAATTRTPGPGPSVPWSLAASLGFAGWIGAGLAFLRWGLTRELRLRPRPAAAWGLIFAGAYATWIAGLVFA